jgi:hypothetical protein
MKKIVSAIAVMLCLLVVNVQAINKNDGSKKSASTECSCCKNCKDEKCKELCTKWCGMTAEARKSDEGKKVKEECMKICKEKKCCSADGKTTCEAMMDGKDCCKKK